VKIVVFVCVVVLPVPLVPVVGWVPVVPPPLGLVSVVVGLVVPLPFDEVDSVDPPDVVLSVLPVLGGAEVAVGSNGSRELNV
jgi:hypothetical protein